jgi:hypothetical protein
VNWWPGGAVYPNRFSVLCDEILCGEHIRIMLCFGL